MTQPAPIISARDVRFAYGAREVLHSLSLDVQPGEFIGLAGPNGAGKSTLLQLLTGFLHPDAGTVSLRGAEVCRMRRAEVAREIAFVAQKSEIDFPFTVLEVVLMGRHPYAGLGALDSAPDITAAQDALRKCGLHDHSATLYGNLSGGEQQLVLLARAFAQGAPILVLDEPVSFLDLRRQWQIMNLLADARRGGTTIIATFHDLNIAARWASRLVLMNNGQLIADGVPADILSAELLGKLYDVPLTVESTPHRPVRVDFP
ncbi:MAG: ABC transporter ATP-binding protein [Candidatus Sumerlaeaceae bacterium]|nr:ABC transporter ATP-binding protein [Candidatus Sumerlaeaceae bacterium]